MMESDKNLKNTKLMAVSLLIFSLLALQFLSSFRLLCLPGSLAKVIPYIRICDPTLWPFLSYPMYSRPHYLGDPIYKLRIYGVHEDNTEVNISQKELGIRITQFMTIHQTILETKDEEQIRTVVDLYERNMKKQLVEISLGYDSVIFTENGFVPGEPKKLMTFRVDSLGGTP